MTDRFSQYGSGAAALVCLGDGCADCGKRGGERRGDSSTASSAEVGLEGHNHRLQPPQTHSQESIFSCFVSTWRAAGPLRAANQSSFRH